MKLLSPVRAWFRLNRHDIRSTLPAAIQGAFQPYLLEGIFEDALLPDFLFPMSATTVPVQANMGDTIRRSRRGLLTPITTPITGSDAAPATYGIEQWDAVMDQYGQSIDTNMLASIIAFSSKYAEDLQVLGVNAGQSLNQVARNKLYAKYTGGRSWAPSIGSASTALVVNDATGFDKTLINGTLTVVSGTNTLNITVGGSAAVVNAVNLGTNTLTLTVAASWAAGAAVVAGTSAATTAPYQVLPAGANSSFDVTSSNVATFAAFRTAVARLRRQNVPSFNGYYHAHIDAVTEGQLFSDADFKQALQGRVDSPEWQGMSIGRFGGIDWIRNNEVPFITNAGSGANLTVRRPIVVGVGALYANPLEGYGDLLANTNAGGLAAVSMISPVAGGPAVALITRAPQDRLAQNVSTTWSFVGDFSVPSDSLVGDTATYKRAVVVPHYGI